MSFPSDPVRTPPRFVPTLTTVVELPEPVRSEPEPTEPRVVVAPAPVAPMAEVPLLADLDFGGAAPSAGRAGMVAMDISDEEALRLEEHLLHRVLQRVDLSLEARLTDTVSAAVQAQLDLMMPRLRRQIEEVLRAVITEALARELSETPAPDMPSHPTALG